MTDRSRWLFAWLAVITLLLSLPAAVSVASGGLLFMGLGVSLLLIASWGYGFVTGRVPLALDALDAVLFALISQAFPHPTVVLGAVFTALWLRGLYGSTLRALVRSALYSLGLVGALLLWPLLHAPDNEVAAIHTLGSIPALFLTVVILRQLGIALQSWEQAMQRDQELAATGSLLLGSVDATAIGTIGRAGAENLCAATPGLRVVRAVLDGADFRIDGTAGDFVAVLHTMPGTVIVESADAARIADSSVLDAAVGIPLVWVCLRANEGDSSWIIVGAPKRIPAGALVSVRSLFNQVALALRNSSVQQMLTTQATSDALTGLDNRASFLAKLATILARTRSPDKLQVLFLDLDDFKNVNDALGHRAGDDLLITVAKRMRAHTRPDDVCARLGGDEFAIVLADTPGAMALEIASRLGKAIAEPVQLGENTSRVGASIGLATARADVSLADLVHEADVAMYAAKAHGKNQIQTYEPGLLRTEGHDLAREW